MSPLLIFFIILAYISLPLKATLYNQKQTGKENYQIDLEDVVVVALLEGIGGDYDEYTYDYSDLTVKPEEEHSSTTSTTTVTTDNSTATITSPSVEKSTTIEPPTSTTIVTLTENNGSAQTPNATSIELNHSSVSTTKQPPFIPEHPLNTHNMQIPVVIVTEAAKKKKGYVSSSTLRQKQHITSDVDTESLPKRVCLQGFSLDEKNRCKKVNRKNPLSTRNRLPLPYGLHYAQRPTQMERSGESS